MAMQAEFDTLLTDREVSSRLGCSARTVRRLSASGELPGFRVRNLRRWRASDVAAYLEKLGSPKGSGVVRG